MLLYEAQRIQVAKAALTLFESGLVVNTSGNVSTKIADHVLITPSGRSYNQVEPRDIVVLDLQGAIIDGDLLPSSETPLHLSIYNSNPETGAIVHTHSVHATAVSTLLKELPAIHYQIADLGGPVPVAPYRTFGTPALAAVVTEVLQNQPAALMQNHGAVTVGNTIAQALARSITLEWLSQVFLQAHQCGEPSLIENEELDSVRKRQKQLANDRRKHLETREEQNG